MKLDKKKNLGIQGIQVITNHYYVINLKSEIKTTTTENKTSHDSSATAHSNKLTHSNENGNLFVGIDNTAHNTSLGANLDKE